jgi:hypothetical protein
LEERLSILSNQNTLGLFGDIGLIADDELPIRGARYRGIFVDYHFVIENSFFPGCDAYGIKTHNSCNDCEPALTIGQSVGLPHARKERMMMTNKIEDE